MVEAEEIEALASLAQVHNPRLRLVGLEPKLREQRPERCKRAPSLALGPTDHDEIVGVTDEHTLPACLPPPVLLSGRLERYYGRLRRPPGIPPTSRLPTG